MEENREQMEQTSHTAEAEKTTGEHNAEISLGKFKDVPSLLKAYNSLQSEFTKRCQRIKELEGAINSDKAEADVVETTEKTDTTTEETAPKTIAGGDGNDAENSSKKPDKAEILKEYLREVLGAKQQAVVMGSEGVGVKTPAHKPTTIEQAGMLAKEILNN